MFATTSMGSISLYQTGESDKRIRAAKYFVFFYVPLIAFNYFGIRAEAGAGIWALYWVVFFTWASAILYYVYSTFRLPMLMMPSAQMDLVRSESKKSVADNSVEAQHVTELMEVGHSTALEKEASAETDSDEEEEKGRKGDVANEEQGGVVIPPKNSLAPRVIAKSTSGSVLSFAHDKQGQIHTNVFLCKVEYVDTSAQRNFWARGIKGQIAFAIFASFFFALFILRASNLIKTPIASLLLFVLVATTGVSVATLGLYRFPTYTFRNKIFIASSILLYGMNFGAGLTLFLLETTNKNASPSESRALNRPCVFLGYFDM